ncbi:MAG: hypothetical protein F6K00_10660 [Leptolyngbya sp. SIOISBB]|nr:hypothetical protein [Leptolyngbya sp. SIOISBB]
MMFAQLPLNFKAWQKVSRSIRLVGAVVSVGWLVGCVAPAEMASESPERPDLEQPLPPEMVPEQVSDRVLAQASQELQLPINELSILRVNQETWLDGCLGLGRPDEGCLQALVPGWQLEVVHQNQSDFYRTDNDGTAIRRSTLDNNLPPSIAAKVIDLASAALGIPANQLTVTAAEPRPWNGCLGVAPPDTACTEIAIFGWQAVVEGNGETLIYHTDMTGDDIRLNDVAR